MTTVDVQAAVDALPSLGGEVVLPGGVIPFNALTFRGRTGVTIRGQGGRTNGAGAATILEYPGSGASSIITAYNAANVGFADMMIRYTDPTFAGKMIDVASGGYSGPFHLDNVIMQGPHRLDQKAILLYLPNSQEVSIRRCYFQGGYLAIYGQDGFVPNVGTANVISISDTTRFWGQVKGPIWNGGIGWSVRDCNFEGLLAADGVSSKPGLFDHAPGIRVEAITFDNCWAGDQTDISTAAWIKIAGQAINVRGCRFGGRQTSHVAGLQIDEDNCAGITYMGNAHADMYTGIDFGATKGHSDVSFLGNAFHDNAPGYQRIRGTNLPWIMATH